ncbi:MAG: transcription antitermination factor NusB [Melioribacteraceae bacterium]|nr:transcription antitermination factor NusB [Melioribacteraceae bacterium]MCF8264366.1 transcription antitermination factor NusB [Melioribacteraceae bacterium]
MNNKSKFVFANLKKSKRRILREKSLQVLYAYEMQGEGLTNLSNGILAEITDPENREFAVALINKVVAEKPLLDEIIKKRLANWDMDRIALIDRLLLRIGIAELLHFDDIPPKVTINEVIEIAKDYSTSNSGKFINGILDAVLKELVDSGKLVKTGRGLVDKSFQTNPTGTESEQV